MHHSKQFRHSFLKLFFVCDFDQSYNAIWSHAYLCKKRNGKNSQSSTKSLKQKSLNNFLLFCKVQHVQNVFTVTWHLIKTNKTHRTKRFTVSHMLILLKYQLSWLKATRNSLTEKVTYRIPFAQQDATTTKKTRQLDSLHPKWQQFQVVFHLDPKSGRCSWRLGVIWAFRVEMLPSCPAYSSPPKNSGLDWFAVGRTSGLHVQATIVPGADNAWVFAETHGGTWWNWRYFACKWGSVLFGYGCW